MSLSAQDVELANSLIDDVKRGSDANADPSPTLTRDEIGRMKRELMQLRGHVSKFIDCPFSTPVSDMATVLVGAKERQDDLREDLNRADELNEQLTADRETLMRRLDHAVHAAYRLAALSCDITGADALAVRGAADRCCDKGDESDKPEDPRREYREG